jgi:hypothetical protein
MSAKTLSKVLGSECIHLETEDVMSKIRLRSIRGFCMVAFVALLAYVVIVVCMMKQMELWYALVPIAVVLFLGWAYMNMGHMSTNSNGKNITFCS